MRMLIVSALVFWVMLAGELRADTIRIGNTLLTTTVNPVTGQTQFQFLPVSTASTGSSIFNPFSFAGAGVPLTVSNTSVFNPFPLTGASTPLIGVQNPAGVFNPFPFEGASRPLVATNTSVFNPFPFTGATAPLAFPGSGVVTATQLIGPGSAPFFPNSPVASAPAAGSVVLVTPTNPSGSVFNPFLVAGATAPLATGNTSLFNPFPFAGAVLTPDGTVFIFGNSSGGSVTLSQPEPGSWLFLATGLSALWLVRRRFLFR
jgi:hypothetical protein